MSDPHRERRSRWLDGVEILEFNKQVWIEESHVYMLMDRELAFERLRNAKIFCSYCREEKPSRDRKTNTFMHQIYAEESPTVRTLKIVPCYADAIWRNEDQ